MATANHVLLRRITLTSSASSVVFDSIPQTGYTDLKIVISARGDAAYVNNGCFMQINSVTSGYSGKDLYSSGSSAGSSTNPYGITSKAFVGAINGTGSTSNTFGNKEVYIPAFTSSNQKAISVDSVIESNGTEAYIDAFNALCTTTAAITSLTFTLDSGNFVAGSSFSLYGIADVNTTPALAPKADGGDIIKTDGTYWYHAFLSTGTFKPQVNLTADVLVVAGGGGGADNIGGAGGAGGLRYLAAQALASTTSYVATIGSGGTGGPGGGGQSNGTKGGNSSLAGSGLTTINATGGGYGAIGDTNGGSGGSGGGTRATVGNGGTGNEGGYSPVEGYNGGKGLSGTTAGGGGGAGTAGATAPSTSQSGNGGAGVNTYSAWATATGTGASGYYAGGGGAGGYPAASVTAGTGGAGGGGNGGSGTTPGAAGTANTGSGGGGGSSSSGTQYAGGNGGSGIIIIRYPV